MKVISAYIDTTMMTISLLTDKQNIMRKRNFKPVILVFLLGLWWLVLSPNFETFFIASGVFSLFLTYYFVRKLGVFPDNKILPLNISFIGYLFWLIREIASSSWRVAIHIIKNEKSPTIQKLKTVQTTESGLALYGNSITLTPGTVTINADSKAMLVHALTEENMEDLKKGEMDNKVKKVV
jgi:multicomponent Na+:H+ antiporter subunit E